MDIFNVPGHFLGPDYIHGKKPRSHEEARSHGSKTQKFNFWANFKCIYVSMPIPAHGFLLFK